MGKAVDDDLLRRLFQNVPIPCERCLVDVRLDAVNIAQQPVERFVFENRVMAAALRVAVVDTDIRLVKTCGQEEVFGSGAESFGEIDGEHVMRHGIRYVLCLAGGRLPQRGAERVGIHVKIGVVDIRCGEICHARGSGGEQCCFFGSFGCLPDIFRLGNRLLHVRRLRLRAGAQQQRQQANDRKQTLHKKTSVSGIFFSIPRKFPFANQRGAKPPHLQRGAAACYCMDPSESMALSASRLMAFAACFVVL